MRALFVLVAVLISASYVLAETPKDTSLDEGRRLGNFCSSCHGEKGYGPGQTIPYIAGQSKDYLVNSLKDMRDKKRYSTLMQLIAQGYTDEDIEKIASWYSSQDWKNNTNTYDKKLVEKGKKLSAQCADCHGEKGYADGETPRIAGLPSPYIYYAMLEYKAGKRNSDGTGASMSITEELSDDDIKALAEYYSSLK